MAVGLHTLSPAPSVPATPSDNGPRTTTIRTVEDTIAAHPRRQL